MHRHVHPVGSKFVPYGSRQIQAWSCPALPPCRSQKELQDPAASTQVPRGSREAGSAWQQAVGRGRLSLAGVEDAVLGACGQCPWTLPTLRHNSGGQGSVSTRHLQTTSSPTPCSRAPWQPPMDPRPKGQPQNHTHY